MTDYAAAAQRHGAVTLANLPAVSQRHFPLCMQVGAGLVQNQIKKCSALAQSYRLSSLPACYATRRDAMCHPGKRDP